MQRLKLLYIDEVVPYMTKLFSYKNIHEVPKITKVIVNKALNESCQNKKIIDSFINEMNLITCQYPKISRSRKAIANFKLKKKTPIGLYVTLRDEKMYSFLDRLINISLPRIRDFQGVNIQSFDEHGNYNLGFIEQIMFADIDLDKIVKVSGINITICINSKKKDQSYTLLKGLGVPFKMN
uniref:Large ribosomal subunit protein uL5c n=1 Tax=Trachelomonas grandis TaxID=215769 RepID=A0A385UKZ8_9EUGL|nr:ribosomal protein L5 [Trachelomonas grandis]